MIYPSPGSNAISLNPSELLLRREFADCQAIGVTIPKEPKGIWRKTKARGTKYWYRGMSTVIRTLLTRHALPEEGPSSSNGHAAQISLLWHEKLSKYSQKLGKTTFGFQQSDSKISALADRYSQPRSITSFSRTLDAGAAANDRQLHGLNQENGKDVSG
ncbi:hypothetical protein K435DRAFT_808450 [Dendrothele bispora CBS 962.96]|uniref:Uncharacterized protein n=1 Tax=Dendrothele bispora (strain CBS 962.96) TaxID=1314807 RepID=A0A4S8L1M1_DENBC|nr:hypothetical protein K435DRAFT_808450 [Dendrothele bispora CBS 962.96]